MSDNKFNARINNALLLIDRSIEDLQNGFIACDTCGDQEDTKTLDCMDDLKMAKSELLAFIDEN